MIALSVLQGAVVFDGPSGQRGSKSAQGIVYQTLPGKWSHPLFLVVTPTLSSRHTSEILCGIITYVQYVGCGHTHYPTHQLADTHRLRTHPPISVSPLLRWIPQSVAHSYHHWI